MISFDQMLAGPAPILALAPMQDVTDLAFWRLMAAYGGAGVYFTEYFRVHATSNLEKDILKSIVQNPTGRPVIAQIIGEDIPSLVRAARELQSYPIAAVDLNLGCPAPIVCRKKAGGGLLRDPGRIDAILGALRDAIRIKFTVKTRLGFDSPETFDVLLPIYARHSLDMLTVHARTVREMYRGQVRYDLIARAAAQMPCPVLANGDVDSPEKAVSVLEKTRAHGVMIGRAAIRNPWIFSQIRDRLSDKPIVFPTGRQVWAYLRELFVVTTPPGIKPRDQVEKMKKYLTYVAPGVDSAGEFLHQIRRMTTEADFSAVCARFLDHDIQMLLMGGEAGGAWGEGKNET
jgi:tRNA-dihydrouridine synthase B